MLWRNDGGVYLKAMLLRMTASLFESDAVEE
jgi:hypothetical protein